MENILHGNALKYGDNINTDIISPPAYMSLPISEAARYSMSPIDATFSERCRPGDIFVAEKNLGSGSSRETAPLALVELGIRVVIAKSFARIFYRNCINLGLLAIECESTERIHDGDELEVDYLNGSICDRTTGETLSCKTIPAYIIPLIQAGGLVNYLKLKFKKE